MIKKVFKDEKYSTMAQKAGNVVWENGLLRKGVGICHGIGGNGLVFLLLYKTLRKEEYLEYANLFADFAWDRLEKLIVIPDRPYSLFEGLAGYAFFILQLLHAEDPKFPCFDVA